MQSLIVSIWDNSRSICTGRLDKRLLFTLASWLLIFTHLSPQTVKVIQLTLSASESQEGCLSFPNFLETIDDTIDWITTSNAPHLHPDILKQAGRSRVVFCYPQLNPPSEMIFISAPSCCTGGIWPRGDEQWEAYSDMFYSAWRLVKLSSQPVLRSRQRPMKSV